MDIIETPDYIKEYVRQNLGLEPDDTSKDKEIEGMPKIELLNRVCQWTVGGRGYEIHNWVDDIYQYRGRLEQIDHYINQLKDCQYEPDKVLIYSEKIMQLTKIIYEEVE